MPKAKLAAVFALALAEVPKAKAVFALPLLDIDDCDCRGKDVVEADVRMSKAESLEGLGNPFTPSGNKLTLLEELAASGAESFGR